jgi:hypothetical protein
VYTQKSTYPPDGTPQAVPETVMIQLPVVDTVELLVGQVMVQPDVGGVAVRVGVGLAVDVGLGVCVGVAVGDGVGVDEGCLKIAGSQTTEGTNARCAGLGVRSA